MKTTQHIDFPLPFSSHCTMAGGGNAPYLVAAMFTASYANKAARLARSCKKFSLPFELHEVPTVHRSMSTKGSDDLRFTKANFVHHLLDRYEKPVLYLDADCEFFARPTLIDDLYKARCDFAVYNFLADEYTDQFYPIGFEPEGVSEPSIRYFKFGGSIDWLSKNQLIAYGITQYFGDSFAARSLLKRWHLTVAEFPGCADDDCLDFTYNNLPLRDWLSWVLRRQWLPKQYARGIFWIYIEPVINHQEIPSPSTKFPVIHCPRGRKRFYSSVEKKRDVNLLFPRDCIIDVRDGMLCRLVDGKPVPFEELSQQFWV